VTHGQRRPSALRRGEDRARRVEVVRERLLDEARDAALEERNRHLRMRHGRHRDHDRARVLRQRGEHVGRAAPRERARLDAEFRTDLLRALGTRVDHGRELDVRALRENARVERAEMADADDRDAQALSGRHGSHRRCARGRAG